MEVCGYYAFVTGYNLGLRIIDIYDTDMDLVGSYNKAGYTGTTKVCIWGDYAYLTYWDNYGNSWMDILHIADPAYPELVGSLDPTGGLACHSFITGDSAYIADGSTGLTEADISDADDITITETCYTSGSANKVTFDGTYLYVASGGSGLRIVDPAGMDVIGLRDTDNAKDIELQGDYAYLADEYGGMVVVDVATPTTPVPAGLYDPDHNISGVSVTGGYAYVADSTSNSLIVLDLLPWD